MRLTDALSDTLAATLDARLAGSDRPVAVAVSGGGDSIALMHMAAGWARVRGRRLIVLTVDHRLHPDSAIWTAQAGRAADALGLAWRALAWAGPRPASGVPAAARRARHALLAEAARDAGARVVLMAHTADDRAENDRMRADGLPIGGLSEWSPSPVWPEGRDVMLLRPLLGAGRRELRHWLSARGLNWFDDPANADLTHPRIRARRELAGFAMPSPAERPLPGTRSTASVDEAFAGVIRLPRDTAAVTLAAAVLCVGGGETPPRCRRLAALVERLRGSGPVAATLAGARIEGGDDGLTILRDAGEASRNGLCIEALRPGVSVWDGRYEIAVDKVGWTVAPARGRLAGLSSGNRAWLSGLPPAARGTVPVLIGDDPDRPVLAWRAARVRCLVPGRFHRAVGGSTQARDQETPSVGEMAPGSLSD